ncbi:MAG: PD-(D/E)XK nuclease family protein [Gammaproteobacteria bacterium]
MSRLQPNASCLAHLESGGLLLTADLRQARILRRLHDRAQVARGLEAWPAAQVMPFEAWLAERWRDAGAERHELPCPLPPVALRWLWKRLAGHDAAGLLDAAELGARARATWLKLLAHGGEVQGLARWPLTRDQQAFAGWARAVERELRGRNACDPGDLARLLLVHDALPDPGPPLLLAGFRRPTPAQAALFAALARRGWRLTQLGVAAAAGSAWQHAAADPESEQAAMLGWARARLEALPDGIHGLIVPDLAMRRGAVERALQSALQPELELPEAGRQRVFDLAGGPPLASHPVVEIAFDAIECALGEADWTLATRLLRSRQLAGAAAERDARTRLDVALRGAGRAYPAAPGALAEAARRGSAPRFADAVAAATARLTGPRRREAAAWAEAFGACLAAWGWPGETALDTAAWQAAARLRELLHELATLATVAQSWSAPEALLQLREIAAAPFQPESGEPAVFVLDAWEDPGLQFDSLWVAGLTASAWPRPVAVDPLLPIEAQRRLGMPGATADACVLEARAVLACWQARAGALVLSWPRRENDTDVDASPLLPPELPPLRAWPAFATRERLLHGAVLEPVLDDPAPPIAEGRVAGGARVLELQSLCPFRAFAQLRLHAVPLEEPQGGIDRRLRGQLLHRALERLWSDLGTQQALLALDDSPRATRVAAAVAQSVADLAPAGVGERSLRLERDWQERAIANLLALERARPPFSVVETERELDGRIGGLELRLCVDRVDETNGELVVIDYKTGAARGAPWRGARMDAPQLPLYAVLHPRRPAGIAIAEAGGAHARLVGVGDKSLRIPGVVPAEAFKLTEQRESGFGWRQVTEHWWAWLDRLARDHAEGRAEVDPKLAAATCRHCHLAALCRVGSGAADDGGAEPVADGD